MRQTDGRAEAKAGRHQQVPSHICTPHPGGDVEACCPGRRLAFPAERRSWEGIPAAGRQGLASIWEELCAGSAETAPGLTWKAGIRYQEDGVWKGIKMPCNEASRGEDLVRATGWGEPAAWWAQDNASSAQHPGSASSSLELCNGDHRPQSPSQEEPSRAVRNRKWKIQVRGDGVNLKDWWIHRAVQDSHGSVVLIYQIPHHQL